MIPTVWVLFVMLTNDHLIDNVYTTHVFNSEWACESMLTDIKESYTMMSHSYCKEMSVNELMNERK